MSKLIYIPNPELTTPPYYFGDDQAMPEGRVMCVQSILERFEPIDVISVQFWICDSEGKRLQFLTDVAAVSIDNEYPPAFAGMRCQIVSIHPDPALLRVIRKHGNVEFLD